MVTPLLVEQAPAKLDSKDKSAAPRPSTLTELDFMIAGGYKKLWKNWCMKVGVFKGSTLKLKDGAVVTYSLDDQELI